LSPDKNSAVYAEFRGFVRKGQQVDDFIGKPFKAEEIFNILQKYLDVVYPYQESGIEAGHRRLCPGFDP